GRSGLRSRIHDLHASLREAVRGTDDRRGRTSQIGEQEQVVPSGQDLDVRVVEQELGQRRNIRARVLHMMDTGVTAQCGDLFSGQGEARRAGVVVEDDGYLDSLHQGVVEA